MPQKGAPSRSPRRRPTRRPRRRPPRPQPGRPGRRSRPRSRCAGPRSAPRRAWPGPAEAPPPQGPDRGPPAPPGREHRCCSRPAVGRDVEGVDRLVAAVVTRISGQQVGVRSSELSVEACQEPPSPPAGRPLPPACSSRSRSAAAAGPDSVTDGSPGVGRRPGSDHPWPWCGPRRLPGRQRPRPGRPSCRRRSGR